MRLTPSAYLDTFARDNLPPFEQWPDLINLDKLAYPERMNCAVELLDRAIEEGFGNKTVIQTPTGSWTYRELNDNANRIAHVLRDDLKLIPGERVLLHAPNNLMTVACWFAILKAGGIVVQTMPLLRARELSVISEKAVVTHVLYDHRLKEAVDETVSNVGSLKHVLGFGNGELEGKMANKGAHFPAVETAADDVALIAFTSGTTGMPKGTMHFHRDVLAICDCFPKSILKPSVDDVFIGSPPLAFTFGLGGILLFPMRARASTILLEKAPPPELTKACVEHGATVCFTSPTGYRFMLDNIPDMKGCNLRKCVSAGETLPKATSDAWFERTGIRVIDGIGSTEMLHIFISASGDDIKPGSTGRPIPLYEAKIIDENGASLPAGEVGRLGVRGPTGCRYLADERQKEYVKEGWNLTGDAYLRDEEGYYWFQARTDDMILSGGYNISGPEIEQALLLHPCVKECAVVASPDEMRGNIVKAFVVIREESAEPGNALVETLQEFVKGEIAPYKYPRAIEFVDALPKTESGKVQRFKLRQQEIEAASAVLK